VEPSLIFLFDNREEEKLAYSAFNNYNWNWKYSLDPWFSNGLISSLESVQMEPNGPAWEYLVPFAHSHIYRPVRVYL